MRVLLLSSMALTAIAAPALTAPAKVQMQPTGLEDLVGARAGQAEAELQRRGYRNTGGAKGDDRSYTYWWSDQRRQCVSIATQNGRYESITPTLPPDCGQSTTPIRPRPPHSPPPPPGAAGVLPGELSRYCRGEASARFDLRPSEITVNAPIRQPNGYIVQGWFAQDKRTKFFNCRFDSNGRFLSVY